MSTENQEPVTVEAAAEEKTETKEVKGTKRVAEVSIILSILVQYRYSIVPLSLNHYHTKKKSKL
jgi:hypothetical protein